MADAKLTVGVGANTKEFEAAISRAIKKLEDFGQEAKKANEEVGRSGQSGAKGLSAISAATAGATAAFGRLAAISGAVVGAIAAIAAPAAALYAVAKAGDDAANSMRKLEALIKVTGHAAGFTGEQIREFARELAYNTLASTKDVENAAGKLLTYNKVTGDAFKQTLTLSQDLATIGFGSLEENANRLGKALQDPIAGVGALKEVGVSFSSSQQTMIKSLVETGNVAKAQGVILEAVAGQVGGAGASQGGLAAGFDALTQRVGEFFEVLDKRMGASDLFGKVLTKLAESVNFLNESLDTGEQSENQEKIAEAMQKRVKAEERLAEVKKKHDEAEYDSIRRIALEEMNAEKRKIRKLDLLLKELQTQETAIVQEKRITQETVKTASAETQSAIAAEERAAMLSEVRKRSDEVIASMQKEVALFGEKSELERVQWELQRGAYKDFAPAEKTKIENLAKELDLKKQLLEQDELAAKMDKLKLPEPFDGPTKGQQMDEAKARADELFRFYELNNAQMEDIVTNREARLKELEAMSMDQRAEIVTGGLATMTEALGKHSKAFFKINKVAGIANAVVNTAQGVTEALKLPFPMNLAAAAATAAAGLAQIQTIRSQEFGSGGAAAAPATGGAAATAATTAPAQEPSRRYISVQGLDTASLFDSRSVRELIRQIQVELGDGVVLTA